MLAELIYVNVDVKKDTARRYKGFPPALAKLSAVSQRVCSLL